MLGGKNIILNKLAVIYTRIAVFKFPRINASGIIKDASVSKVKVLVGIKRDKYKIIIVRAVKTPPKAICLAVNFGSLLLKNSSYNERSPWCTVPSYQVQLYYGEELYCELMVKQKV